jgi:predicted component of type VI protein secretion system
MSYSDHFRKKVLAKLDKGYSTRAVVAQFEIDKNTIVQWKKCIAIKRAHPLNPVKSIMMFYVLMLKHILMSFNMNGLQIIISS